MIHRHFLIFCLLLILPGCLFSQQAVSFILAADNHELLETIHQLASSEMEGRETGTPGGQRAASFIAGRMNETGLQPFSLPGRSKSDPEEDYFIHFSLNRYIVQSPAVSIGSTPAGVLVHGTDYTLGNVYKSIRGNFPLVFAGYGIILPGSGVNDYKGLDIKGKIILIMEGYPGEGDTLSAAWKHIRALAAEDGFDIEKRCSLADSLGAIAVMVLDHRQWAGERSAELPGSDGCPYGPLYQDAEYLLPGSAPGTDIPCIRLGLQGSKKVSDLVSIPPGLIQAYSTGIPPGQFLMNSSLELDLQVKNETLEVPNVLGMIRGVDTSRTVVIGAHYDHLGKRGPAIFYGADDNASGVSGLLALAKSIKTSEIIPPCNLVFASWTAEEKGLLGSAGFVSRLPEKHTVELYINMDMISRSDPQDSARNIVSIGTRSCDSALRSLAELANLSLQSSLQLDLWNVNGHHGSDYASFTGRNIPVMTFFSGFHNDYHSPCDLPEKCDTKKMTTILELIMGCLNRYLYLN